MDELKPLVIFAETVAAGSMSAAARRLGMSPSAVSQAIRALEAQGGVTLLHRSTRKLALTDAGARYYPHCRRVLEAARAAADSLQLARDAPSGELRLSAPVGFASHLAPALAPLLADAPQLRLGLFLDDAMIDLIDARIDVAIRVGQLADSSWVARKLCDFDTILCASPAYLERHGTPAQPRDLPAHQWLALRHKAQSDSARRPAGDMVEGVFAAQDSATALPSNAASGQGVAITLEMTGVGGQSQAVAVQARIASNNQIALQHLCEQGMGIMPLMHAEVLEALQRGALVQVLPAWRLPAMPVWAVTPRREGEAAKVRAALDCLKRYFAALPGTVQSAASNK